MTRRTFAKAPSLDIDAILANRDIRNEIDTRLRAALGLPAAEAGTEKAEKTEKTKIEAPEAVKKKP